MISLRPHSTPTQNAAIISMMTANAIKAITFLIFFLRRESQYQVRTLRCSSCGAVVAGDAQLTFSRGNVTTFTSPRIGDRI